MPDKFPYEYRDVLISEDRRKSVDPDRLVSELPIEPHHRVADIGCGNGFFTLPLARYLTSGKVLAVDISELMLRDLRDRVSEAGLGNVEVVQSQEAEIPIEAQSLDGIFSAFMFHETLDPPAFLSLIKGLTKPGGWLALLEWRKQEMEEGPPFKDRIEEEDCLNYLQDAGFQLSSRPYLNDKQYMFLMTSLR